MSWIFYFYIASCTITPSHVIPSCSFFSTSSSTCRQGHSGPLKQRSSIFYGVNSRLFSIVFPVLLFRLLLLSSLVSCVHVSAGVRVLIISWTGRSAFYLCPLFTSFPLKDTSSLHLFLLGEIFIINSYLFAGASYQP